MEQPKDHDAGLYEQPGALLLHELQTLPEADREKINWPGVRLLIAEEAGRRALELAMHPLDIV